MDTKKMRNYLGITQEEFACKIGMSTRHYQRIENGRMITDLQKLAIKKAFDEMTDKNWEVNK